MIFFAPTGPISGRASRSSAEAEFRSTGVPAASLALIASLALVLAWALVFAAAWEASASRVARFGAISRPSARASPAVERGRMARPPSVVLGLEEAEGPFEEAAPLALALDPPVRGQVVDQLREHLRQHRRDLPGREPGLLGQLVDLLGAEGRLDLIGRDLPVRPAADP